jgi:phytoene synthase
MAAVTALSGRPPGSTLADAYRYCAEVTTREARNFSYGIRLLPADRRAAMQAVYALSRRIDDIGDGTLPTAEKVAGLVEVRKGLRDTDPTDPVLLAVADVARRLPLPLDAFDDLIDGVEMDVVGTTVADFDALVLYCRRVAGSVGRLSLGVYGVSDPRAHALGDDLGVALQQTNVLRDVREDLGNGRVYLPADELAAAGVTLTLDPVSARLGGPEPALLRYLTTSAERAETWYRRGLGVLPMMDRRSAACTAAMAGIYRRLNATIATDPAAVLDKRLSLPAGEKIAVALKALVRRAA